MELACIVSYNLPFLLSSLCNLHHVEFSSFQVSNLLLYLCSWDRGKVLWLLHLCSRNGTHSVTA